MAPRRDRWRSVVGLLVAGIAMLPAVAPTPAGASPASSDVRSFAAPDSVIGEASLVRSPNGASFTFRTTGLTKGHAYTIWFVAFNHPEACVGGCGADDLSNPAVQASSLWAAGHFAGGGNTFTFSGRRSVGEPGDPDRGETGPGLLDPYEAEIHLVLRTHGPRIPGMANDQIDSFNGGCHAGEPNEGQCANLQFAVFLPMS